ncbi:tRNA modification GTPase MnmE [Roseobacter fucihabitans]|uniref:tRNA modification GTPase MnmE n=1 Tax=Roseobacter fucihabitans TaxID=1537242 RepID=A0ABZ2BZ67_9RHOB|nr:tRNA uridine-5-carboxymethylaminomethyl(34) synthesis GTPase MnmE [Roseobacter litoralis]MBC6963869.1 tRNA modification GTPase MnmE [Roseobacter litoralis]MBC6964046.1 tRNA modification GTPase MnmE [Roseobacter litoralis]
MDTIFALASAQGKAGVSVVRVSGPKAWDSARLLCGNLPEPRYAVTRSLRDHKGGLLDHALVICFQAPRSFTGEDVVEYHVHGSVAAVRVVLAELSRHSDLRMAEPGEFTRRALENEKLDLVQVEGLADLIAAETESQRKQAVRVLSGVMGEKIEIWRADLIRAAALLEATIDFTDEDVPVDVSPEVKGLLANVISGISEEIAGSFVAERIRTGFEVALVGAPNTGKSTLLNRLAGREAAITSEIAGTTRDVIEVRMDLNGLPVTFLDTAGLRATEDEIENIGVTRAIDRARAADLRVFLQNQGDKSMLEPEEDDIVLLPKIDENPVIGIPGVSGKSGEGVSELVLRVQNVLMDRASVAGIATHERHRTAMQRSVEGLICASEILSKGPDNYDLASAELRSAVNALELLVGRVDVENLLDEIFSSFCLGK